MSRPGRSLPPEKTRYPLYRRLGGPQGGSGQVWRSRTHWDSIPGPSSPQQVTIPTELSQPTLLPLIYIQYFPSQPIFKHPRFIFFPRGADQLSYPYKTTYTITVSYISVFKERQNVLNEWKPSYHKFNLLPFFRHNGTIAKSDQLHHVCLSVCLSVCLYVCLSLCLSVCLSILNKSAPTGWIFIKFDIGVFF